MYSMSSITLYSWLPISLCPFPGIFDTFVVEHHITDNLSEVLKILSLILKIEVCILICDKSGPCAYFFTEMVILAQFPTSVSLWQSRRSK